MIRAAAQDDRELVTWLLDLGAAVNAKDRRGATALVAALEHQHPQLARLLIARGADVNGQDRDGHIPLMLAADKGDAAVVNALLDRGAQVNAQSARGETALLTAVRGRRFDLAASLLARGVDINSNQTPLRLAAQEGQSAVVEALLDRGTRITPEALAAAVIGGHVDTVKRLIARGANVNARIIEDHHRDWLVGLIKDLDYVLKRCRQEAPTGGGLRISCDGGLDFDGVPPVLSIAAARGDRDLVQVLLDAGARVDARDAAGRNALSFAIGFDQTGGEIGVVPLLLARGAEVLPVDLGAALLAAVRDGRHDWLKALLDQGTAGRGTGVAAGPVGAAAIFAAARRGDVESVRLLLDDGAAVEARPDIEESPLCLAAGYGHPEVVRLLLARGAAVDVKAADHAATALSLASARSSRSIADLLRQAGAKE